jgi:hypothetical protein
LNATALDRMHNDTRQILKSNLSNRFGNFNGIFPNITGRWEAFQIKDINVPEVNNDAIHTLKCFGYIEDI